MEENKIIAKLGFDENGDKSVKEPVFITLSSFSGHKYVDIRKYYKDGDEWKPTKKGVTMNLPQIDEFIEIVKTNREEIENWFK